MRGDKGKKMKFLFLCTKRNLLIKHSHNLPTAGTIRFEKMDMNNCSSGFEGKGEEGMLAVTDIQFIIQTNKFSYNDYRLHKN
jgi:hypothetical protein